jgi:hypothetical protein
MPNELEETAVDVGDSEETSTDIDVLPAETGEDQETEVKSSASNEELEEYSSNVKGRIDNLTKRFREEERQKQSAIEFAENVRRENDNLKDRLGSLDKSYMEQFEGRVDSQLESAKKLLRDAHEMGDVDQIVEAQEVLSDLTIERSRVKVAKANKQPEAPVPQAPVPQAPVPQASADPRAEKWASSNKWFGEDEVMTYAAFGLHRRLIEDEGFDPSSNDYYDELDKRMRDEFPQKLGSGPKSNGGRKVASAESSKSRNKSGRKTVRLSASQVAIAKRLNVPLEEYAKYVRDYP